MRFAYSPLGIALLTMPGFSVSAEITAKTEPHESLIPVELVPIIVEAKKADVVGQTTYRTEQLHSIPNAKKSITDFLKVHTNVQFARDANSAATQGSLAPNKISINGAPNYENKFAIDGVNTSNTFDPVGESADSNYYGMPSNAQTAHINTDLLCELEIIDSNASAEHGSFQGGVINAKTCAPHTALGQIHGSISYDYTNNSWARYNYVNDEEQALFDEQDATHQKEYTTQGLSFNVYGNLTEQWGVNVFGGRRNSRIPVKSGLSENDKVKTAENNDNIGFNAYFTPSDQHKYQFGIQHYNYDKQGYYANTLGSAYTVNTITNTFFINAEHQFEKFKLEQNLNYRTSELDRKLDHNYSVLWYYAPGSKDWGTGKTDGDSVTEGSFGGDLTNHQDTFAYSLKATLDSLTLLETTHRITAGASYQHNAGSWERPQNMVSYTTRANLANASCALGDPLCDETDLKYRLNNRQPFTDWTGQYSRNGISYGAGMFTARQDQWSTFLQDEIIWKKWRARLGVRTDYDSLSSNLNIAPRISVQYKPFSSDILSFSSGYNRYYGNTFLITELDEKTYTSYGNLSRAATYSPDWNAENDYGWVKSSLASNAGVKASELDTPYSDETLFAIHSKISHFDLGLQWVHRDFKAMLQETNINKLNANGMEVLDYRTYSNVEGGKVDTYTLNISNFKPFEFFNSQHKLSLGLSYVENAAKRGNYKDSVTHAKRDDRIIYEGHLISKDMLPIQDEPFKARLSWDMKGNDIPFTLHHFFNFKSSAVNYIHNEDYELLNSEEIPVYVEKEFASKFTWDIRATYAWNLNPKQSLLLGLTVSNVLNKKNQSVTETSAKTYSDEGRRFIADISYKF